MRFWMPYIKQPKKKRALGQKKRSNEIRVCQQSFLIPILIAKLEKKMEQSKVRIFSLQLLNPICTHLIWQPTCYSCCFPEDAPGNMTFQGDNREGMPCFLLDQEAGKNAGNCLRQSWYPKQKWAASMWLCYWNWEKEIQSLQHTAPCAVTLTLFTGVASGLTLLEMSTYTFH